MVRTFLAGVDAVVDQHTGTHGEVGSLRGRQSQRDRYAKRGAVIGAHDQVVAAGDTRDTATALQVGAAHQHTGTKGGVIFAGDGQGGAAGIQHGVVKATVFNLFDQFLRHSVQGRRRTDGIDQGSCQAIQRQGPLVTLFGRTAELQRGTGVQGYETGASLVNGIGQSSGHTRQSGRSIRDGVLEYQTVKVGTPHLADTHCRRGRELQFSNCPGMHTARGGRCSSQRDAAHRSFTSRACRDQEAHRHRFASCGNSQGLERQIPAHRQTGLTVYQIDQRRDDRAQGVACGDTVRPCLAVHHQTPAFANLDRIRSMQDRVGIEAQGHRGVQVGCAQIERKGRAVDGQLAARGAGGVERSQGAIDLRRQAIGNAGRRHTQEVVHGDRVNGVADARIVRTFGQAVIDRLDGDLLRCEPVAGVEFQDRAGNFAVATQHDTTLGICRQVDQHLSRGRA